MPFRTPSLDNRNYAEILRDALARIPVHNPDWTNFNDSDPGMTLLQLFAFMTESILYRANQIPERNRYKFLELLGVKLTPAAVAKGFVTITNERGSLMSQTQQPLEKGLDVRAGEVRFRTTQGLDVLPLEARVFYKKPLSQTTPEQISQVGQYAQLLGELTRTERYRGVYADLLVEKASDLVLYETTPLPLPVPGSPLPVVDLADTVDRCLWIALLSPRPGETLNEVRDAIANKTLTVGVMPHLEKEGITLQAGQTTRAASRVPAVTWEIASVPPTYGETAPGVNHYVPLPTLTSGSILQAPGLVELQLPNRDKLYTWDWNLMQAETEGTNEYPPSLVDKSVGDRVITWIRMRVGDVNTNSSVKARLSWVGINATQVEQQMSVIGEVVGEGKGEPDQRFRLTHQNIRPDTFILKVDGQPWHPIDDMLAADPEVPINSPRRPLLQSELSTPTGGIPRSSEAELRNRVFTLDPESGEIAFGDGAHGARPRGRIIADYAYGGGSRGNVGIGLIDRSPELSAGYKVTNPLPTWGGEDAQDISSAEKTIPRVLQHRDRLVSVQDFADVTRQTPGVDVGRIEVIPLLDPSPRDTLAAYFTAQTDLLSQIRTCQSDLEPLLSKLQDLLTEQNRLIETAISNQPTNEPYRELQRLLRPYTGNEIPGAVTILVIPANPDYRSTPQPDPFFLEAVSDHLCPRRLVTTELHIRGPVYVDIWVSVAIKVLGGYAIGPVREVVKQALFRFLSPLYGGHGQGGWPLRVAVTAKELEATVARVEGVRAVDNLLLGRQPREEAEDPIQAVPSVAISGLELPRLVNVAVTVVAVGQPGTDAEMFTGEVITPLDHLRRAPRVVDDQKPLTPIPVLPERC